MQESLFDMHQAEHIYEKKRSSPTEAAKVLITVKAKPEPSAKYGDTVCVAGIRLDTEKLHWVRIYPIPFRRMEELQKFQKWSVVEVPLTPAQEDPRAESYKPNRDALKVVENPSSNWKHRLEYLEPMISDLSMCQINSLARDFSTLRYPSLAAIMPHEIQEIIVEPFPGWTEEQKQNVHKELDLFDVLEGRTEVQTLEEPRFTMKIKFLCQELECKSHTLSYLDWELEALSRRLKESPFEEARQEIIKRYSNVLAPEKEVVFFVGNLYAHRPTYQLLGVQRTR